MTTQSAPFVHANTKGDLGVAYHLLPGLVLQEMAERFDPIREALLADFGDVAGTDSDTIRIRRVGGIGAAARFESMAGEVDAGSLSTMTTAYDTATVGRKYLSYSESMQRAGIAADGLRLEDIAVEIPAAALSTVREDLCAVGATLATNVADASSTLDVDDTFALVNAATSQAGFQGFLNAMTKGRQIGYLRNSIRLEAALKFPEPFDQYGRLMQSGGRQFSFLGIDWWASDDVVSDSGDDFGFAWEPGAFGWVRMSTADLGDLADANPLIIPEYGIIMTRETSGQTASKRIHANAWWGVAKLASSLKFQRLLRNDDGV